jgi:hypothetical protein
MLSLIINRNIKVHMLQSRRKTLISMTYFLYIFYELTIVIQNINFNYIMVVNFIDGGNGSPWEKLLDKLQVFHAFVQRYQIEVSPITKKRTWLLL